MSDEHDIASEDLERIRQAFARQRSASRDDGATPTLDGQAWINRCRRLLDEVSRDV